MTREKEKMHFLMKARGLTNSITLNRNSMGRKQLIRCFRIGIQNIKKRNRGGRSSREVATYIRETLVPNQSNILILFTSSSEPI